ncbi:MAG: MmgE/PrpD family protein [Rubrivivax sp.]|nr:MmgE/PrpD family protein [Rubrivivax sp.]
MEIAGGPAIRATAVERVAQAACRVAEAAAPDDPRPGWHLLDWLGCAAHGAGSQIGHAFAQWLSWQGAGTSPTLAGRSADAASAAAYHGSLGSTLEMDDVHRSSILHPGPVVLPAVLAALPVQATGQQLLRGLIAGYEAMIRIGRTLGPAHYRHWHTTGTAGSFGAAAGAAVAMGLPCAQVAQALALAGTRAGGLWQLRHERSLGKAWHMAGAARDGLAAAQLAACGLTGPLGILEGPSGWLAATAEGADAAVADEDAVAGDATRPWLADVSFKPWPACRHAHPAMDALRQAAADAGRALRAEDILRIEAHVYDDALRFCERRHPQDSAQARFSLPHALAAWVLRGEAQLAHYETAALQDPQIHALRERVELQRDAAIQARFPRHYGARVVIHWREGAPSVAELRDTLGDPDRPMRPRQLQAKARGLMQAAGWSAARIDAAVAACEGLARAPDLRALHRVLMPASGEAPASLSPTPGIASR